MTTPASKVRFDDDSMWVELDDGRTIGVPLAWFPRLTNASKSDLDTVKISPHGLHWESLDEDVSIEGLLAGKEDRTGPGEVAARNFGKRGRAKHEPVNLADRSKMTSAEFLRWTDGLPEGERHELVAGEPIAMAPERNRHGLVKVDCCLALLQAARTAKIGCTVLGDGATVVIDDDNVYGPDVTVQCG